MSWLVVGGEDDECVVGEEEREGDEEGERGVVGVEGGVVGMLWVRKSVRGMRRARIASTFGKTHRQDRIPHELLRDGAHQLPRRPKSAKASSSSVGTASNISLFRG